jgi:hypothetical protein
VFPASNIHEALGWIDVCYSFKHPEEMKLGGAAQKPLKNTNQPADASVAKTFYCSCFVSPSGYYVLSQANVIKM